MPEESYEEKMRITKKIRENLVKADAAVKESKLDEAVDAYKEAAELAEGLGHHTIAQDYLKKASDLKPMTVESEPEVISQDPENKFVELAEKAVSAGNFGEAVRLYEEGARKLPANSEKFLKEAANLRNKEKEMYLTKKELQRRTDSMQDYESTLIQIKDALQKNQNQELVSLYGRAAILAEKLGKRTEAGEYRKAAIDVKRKVIAEMKDTKEGRVQLVKQYTEILQQIKQFLDEKKWNEAAEKYMEAAKLAEDMDEIERSKLYKQKAAELKSQAQGLEREISLKEKRLNLLKEIKSLDLEKDNEQILANYTEVLKTYEELKDKEALEEVQKDFKKAEKVGERKQSLIGANAAMEQGNHIKALEQFQRALRISIELNEQTKAEGFRKIIDELKNKVDKVARNRMMIEQRAELLAKAKSALQEPTPNVARIAEDYKEAARISFELGENDIAQSYVETAKRIESNKDLIIERENFIKEAETALKEKKFMMASNFYQQAAKFSDKLGEHELAEKYGKKAKALKDLAEEL
jgi:hypothetical protein